MFSLGQRGHGGEATSLRPRFHFMKTTIATLLAILSIAAFADDETDFTTAPPPSWPTANPLGIASFNYTGATARLTSPAPSLQVAQVAGLARLGLFAPTSYTQTVVSADVVAWGGVRDFASVLARAGTIGFGTTHGYGLTLIPSTGAVEIHRLTGEIPTLLAPTQFITVQAGHTYRLVFVCAGTVLTGRVYDTADLTTPLIEVSANDATYASGITGIVASTDSIVPIDVTFDNFLAWDGTAAPLKVLPADSLPGYIVLESNARRSLASYWESTDDLSLSWSPVTPVGASASAQTATWSFGLAEPQRFFRMRVLGSQ